jgi:hypothetical protein
MSIDANRDLVRNFYAHMSKLDFDEMFALMADDATWTVAGKPELFHHSGVATKPQRIAALANFTKFFATLDMDIRSLTAEEDRVAAEIITRCKTHGGIDYENEILVLVRCKDGQVASIYEHLDQATSLEFERRVAAAAGQPAL